MHPALGGLDTTKAPSLLAPDQVALADNIEYFTSGARKKRLGTTRFNTVAATNSSGERVEITAIADHWRHGTSLSPTQQFILTGGNMVATSSAGGGWIRATASWGATGSTRTHITVAQGFAVITNSNGDPPLKWDQTAMTFLVPAGAAPTLPRFEACSYHLRRLWTAGETRASTASQAANPSRVYVSAAGDITDFQGADTTSFIFEEDDGDRVIGISDTFRGRIYVLKGPNYGSIHEIDGTTLSTFSRKTIVTGVPCVNHASIVTTPNDIFWASRYGFHSLEATEKFGDTEEAFISRPIQSLFNNLNFARLSQIRGFYHPLRNIVGWCAPDGGQTQNNVVFVYNFILDRWAVWRFSFNVADPEVMIDPAGSGQGLPRIYLAGYDGFVREGDQTTLTDDNGSAYTATFRTPVYMRFSDSVTELSEKQFYSVTTFFQPKGNYNVNLTAKIDRLPDQTRSVSMQGGGAVLDTFVFDTDILGGSVDEYVDSDIEGRGRSIQLEYSQGGSNQDMEIYGYAIRLFPGESHAMERSS